MPSNSEPYSVLLDSQFTEIMSKLNPKYVNFLRYRGFYKNIFNLKDLSIGDEVKRDHVLNILAYYTATYIEHEDQWAAKDEAFKLTCKMFPDAEAMGRGEADRLIEFTMQMYDRQLAKENTDV